MESAIGEKPDGPQRSNQPRERGSRPHDQRHLPRLLNTRLLTSPRPDGLDARNGHATPQVRTNVQPLFDYRKSCRDPGPVQGRVRYHWPVAVRRAKLG